MDAAELLCITYSNIGILLVHAFYQEFEVFFFLIDQQCHALLLTKATKLGKCAIR
jgi:hypothetical protein